MKRSKLIGTYNRLPDAKYITKFLKLGVEEREFHENNSDMYQKLATKKAFPDK